MAETIPFETHGRRFEIHVRAHVQPGGPTAHEATASEITTNGRAPIPDLELMATTSEQAAERMRKALERRCVDEPNPQGPQ
jgi:hypothetical protein